MMKSRLHPTPSAGSIIKQINIINPDLGVQEIARIIRQCVEAQDNSTGEFVGVEIINESKALALAQATIAN